MKKTKCEFEIKDMLPIGLTFVVLGIGLTYGLGVMSDVQDDQATLGVNCGQNATGGSVGISYSNCGAAYNASGDAVDGVAKIPEKMPLIATVVVAAIIIGILVRYLMLNYN